MQGIKHTRKVIIDNSGIQEVAVLSHGTTHGMRLTHPFNHQRRQPTKMKKVCRTTNCNVHGVLSFNWNVYCTHYSGSPNFERQQEITSNITGKEIFFYKNPTFRQNFPTILHVRRNRPTSSYY